jgi:hypothetical protein
MTLRQCRWSLLAACCLLTFQLHAQTLQVVSADGHATTLAAEQITKLTHVTVKVWEHDTPAQFEGVPLSEVLAAGGIELGAALHGSRLADALLVSAADGYKVVFALAEVDPAFAVREILLCDKRDGKPLSAKEGPYRIVAPGDKRGARWVRQVVELKVINLR